MGSIMQKPGEILEQKMDLVTREEFELQSKVLAKTREKLEALEAKVAALEKS